MKLASILTVFVVLISALTTEAAKPAQENRTASEQPSPIRYLNDVLGVYVGEKQPNGRTRVILHREDRGGAPEVHFVTGKRVMPHESRSVYALLIGEVELEAGKPLEVYSGVFNLDPKEDDKKFLAAFRASGTKPFRVEAAEIPRQAGTLLKTLSRFEPHTVSKESGLYVEILSLLGKSTHAELLSAHLDGDYFAGCALLRIGEDAQEHVAGIWQKLGETDRWKLMKLGKSVPKTTAVAQAVTSLKSDNKEIRGWAIHWLGSQKASEGRRPLLARLHAEKSSLRWEIVRALAEIGGEDVVDALIELLAPDSWAAKGQDLVHPPGPTPYWWPDGRVSVIVALGKLKAKRSASALLKVLREKGEGKGYLGVFVIPLLGEFGCTPAIPELKRILATTDVSGLYAHSPLPPPPPGIEPGPDPIKEEVNRLAVRTLLQLGDRSARALLLRELAAPEWERRRPAAEALARFGDKRDVPDLAACLTDEDDQVCRWACRGLERITGTARRASGWAESPDQHTKPARAGAGASDALAANAAGSLEREDRKGSRADAGHNGTGEATRC